MGFRSTAAATASISVGSAIVAFALPSPSADVIERYVRFTRPAAHQDDITFDAGVRVPSPKRPAWFSTMITEIQSSVSHAYQANDGRWLTQSVADAATDFFGTTADLLPGQPHIYSSIDGDLVAEFRTPKGTLTGIISPTFTLLFAVVDGVTSERKIVETRRTREEVRNFIKPLVADPHGDLAAQK